MCGYRLAARVILPCILAGAFLLAATARANERNTHPDSPAALKARLLEAVTVLDRHVSLASVGSASLVSLGFQEAAAAMRSAIHTALSAPALSGGRHATEAHARQEAATNVLQAPSPRERALWGELDIALETWERLTDSLFTRPGAAPARPARTALSPMDRSLLEQRTARLTQLLDALDDHRQGRTPLLDGGRATPAVSAGDPVQTRSVPHGATISKAQATADVASRSDSAFVGLTLDDSWARAWIDSLGREALTAGLLACAACAGLALLFLKSAPRPQTFPRPTGAPPALTGEFLGIRADDPALMRLSGGDCLKTWQQSHSSAETMAPRRAEHAATGALHQFPGSENAGLDQEPGRANAAGLSGLRLDLSDGGLPGAGLGNALARLRQAASEAMEDLRTCLEQAESEGLDPEATGNDASLDGVYKAASGLADIACDLTQVSLDITRRARHAQDSPPVQ